jgi:hypothetical protein
MDKNRQNIETLLEDLPKYPVPVGLEQKIIYALRTEQKRSERLSLRLWMSGLFGSTVSILFGLAWSLQSLRAEGAMEIIKTAVSDFEALRFSDVFWGIMENLPLNGLALIFCAITVLGILVTMRKNTRTNILSLQHI